MVGTLNLAGGVHSSWSPILHSYRPDPARLAAFLQQESDAHRPWAPEPDLVLRAFSMPMDDVRVVIVGQDPYPTPGHAVGLAFSVAPDTKPLPRSLSNILRELTDDVGVTAPTCGDLRAWSAQGVLLINRVLTVGANQPGSHRGHGWEPITQAALQALAQRRLGPPVAVLWGRDAQSAARHLQGATVISSAHPSPLSAHRGFFGSRPFSRTNEALAARGWDPIDWALSPNGASPD